MVRQAHHKLKRGRKSDTFIFTSESVCAGHPDKIADQISDGILDAVLALDKNGRVAVETLVTKDNIVLAGEVTVKGKVHYERIARDLIRKLGYTDLLFKFTYRSPISVFIHEQSAEIAVGVDNAGAGDQGMMFGFANRDTDSFMPLPITLSHALAQKIDAVREKKILPYLRPDGKTQVTVEYKNGKPYKVLHVVLAVPHSEKVTEKEVKESLYAQIVQPVLAEYGFSISEKDIIVNGTGVWHIGGPASDTGLTGRKIVVDTYGGYARVGGGAFSGKDPTKVDRSGAYAARYIAKNIVAHGLADKAEVRLAYFIGAKEPLMQQVETFGTRKVSKKALREFVNRLIDTSVAGIIKKLKLKDQKYLPTASYGHFGRGEFTWEKIVK